MGCTASKADKSESHGRREVIKTEPPDWDKEADGLRVASQGLGKDEMSMVRALARFTNKQRRKLLMVYKERFNEDLATVVETELNGAARTVVKALLYTPEMYDVTSLEKAFESEDYDTVVSIIISSRNDSLMDMKETYIAKYDKTLEDDLSKIPDEDIRHIVMSLLNVDRSSARKRADKEAARKRARLLFSDGDVLSLLCEQVGRNQLRETLAAFMEFYRINIGQFIEEKCSNLSRQARDTLKDCVLLIENPPQYFAKEMAKADELSILRMMVARSEIDLYYIKKEFLSMYSRQLHDTIDKQCRFDYARLLIPILELRGQYTESAKKR